MKKTYTQAKRSLPRVKEQQSLYFYTNPTKEGGVKTRPKTFVDLFAGIGGFRIALEDLGLKCVFSCDWDRDAQITYEANFGERPLGDITKIKESEIPSHDILCAGFPCQSFSISGKRLGFEDTRGTLFFEIARIAKHHKPRVLFLENVKNLARHDGGKTLKTIKTVLQDIGYRVFYKIANASQYGIPQSRERIYFVCFLKDSNVTDFNFPEPTYKKIYLKDILERDSNFNDFVIKRKDIEFFSDKKEKEKLGPIQIGKINCGGQGERIYSINGHSVALTAYGGGVASKTGAYLVDGVIRKLTPRECARAQGFPDTFKIPVGKNRAYKLFGNAVPLPVVEAIAKRILEFCE